MSYYLRSRNLMNSAYRYIWFDLETTGFNSYHEHIIEIAAYSSDGEYFNELVTKSKILLKKAVLSINYKFSSFLYLQAYFLKSKAS